MLGAVRRSSARTAALLVVAWSCGAMASEGGWTPTQTPPGHAVIDARLRSHNRAYPEIQFLYLAGDSAGAPSTLQRLLGDGARSLDYEHPPELASEMMSLAVQRVALMLQHSGASASLFRAGLGAMAERAAVCVLTLDSESGAMDDVRATAICWT